MVRHRDLFYQLVNIGNLMVVIELFLGHAAPVSKRIEKAKDSEAIREHYSGNRHCLCARHTSWAVF